MRFDSSSAGFCTINKLKSQVRFSSKALLALLAIGLFCNSCDYGDPNVQNINYYDTGTLTINDDPPANTGVVGLPDRLAVTIYPPSPNTTDELEAVVVGGEQGVSYRYRWHLDGEPFDVDEDGDPAVSGSRVDPRFTEKNQQWTVYAWAATSPTQYRLSASDKGLSGMTEASASVSIKNYPRECIRVGLSQSYFNGKSFFDCECIDGNDADGEDDIDDHCVLVVSGYPAAASPTADGCHIPVESLTSESSLACSLYPGDVESRGEPVETKGVVFNNILPEPPVISLSRQSGSVIDTFECMIDTPSLDRDGDQVSYSYRWLINDFLDDRFQEKTIVAGLLVRDETFAPAQPGDAISCKAIPNDGRGDGAPAISGQVDLAGATCEQSSDCYFGHACVTGECAAGQCVYGPAPAECPDISQIFGQTFRNMALSAPLVGDQFDVTAEGVLDMGLFGPVAVAGTISKAAGESIEWCFDSKATQDVQLAMLWLRDASVRLCRRADGTFDGSFTGSMGLETALAPVTGIFTLGSNWNLEITAVDFDFLGVTFDSFKVATGAFDRQLNVDAIFALGDQLNGPLLSLKGFYVPNQNVRLDIGLAPDFVWMPLPSYPGLIIPSISGVFTRVAGLIDIEIEKQWEGELELAPGFSATGVWVAGRYSSAEPWTVSLGCSTHLDPLEGDTTIFGDYDSGTGIMCLAGDSAVPTDPPTPLSAEACFHLGDAEDPTLTSLTFASDIVYSPPLPTADPMKIEGSYDGAAQVLCMSADTGWRPTEDFISPIMVGLCIDFSLGSPELQELTLSGKLDAEPLGEQWLSGVYNSEDYMLCMSTQILEMPGFTSPVIISTCLDLSVPGIPVLHDISFEGLADIPFVGDTSISGIYENGDLCLMPVSNVLQDWNFPGFSGPVSTRTCLDFSDPSAPHLKDVEFSSEFQADFMATPIPVGGIYLPDPSGVGGNICLEGFPAIALGGGAVSGAVSGVKVCLGLESGNVYVNEVMFTGEIDSEHVGHIQLSGVYLNSELCLRGDVNKSDANWFGNFESLMKVEEFYVQTCLVGGSFDSLSAAVIFTLGENPASADAITLVASVDLEVAGDLSLGVQTAPGCMSASGSCIWTPDSCDPADVCSQEWRPFTNAPWAPANSLVFTDVSGLIGRDSSGATKVDVGGALSAGAGGSSLDIFPGFAIDQVSAQASFGTEEVAFKLRGQYGINLYDESITVNIGAEVSSVGALVFTGIAEPDDPITGFQPLASLIGPDVFRLGALEVIVDADLATDNLMITFNSYSPRLTIPFPAGPLDIQPQLISGGIGSAGGNVGVYFQAAIDQIDVPIGQGLSVPIRTLPDQPAPLVTLSSMPIYLGDHDFNAGISIYAKAECPIPLGADGSKPFGGFEFGFDFTTGKMLLDAELQFVWEIIRPEYNLPGLHSLKTKSLNFKAEVSTVSTFAFGGEILFTPNNPFNNKVPLNELTGGMYLLFDTTGGFGGEIFINSVWYEPFFMPDFAVMNPALLLKLRLLPNGIPIPSSVGINGDFFWLKPNKSWPYVCPPEGPDDGTCISATVPNANVPTSVLHAGGTLFFDVTVTPSGFFGAPLPPVIVRLNVNNLDGAGDFVGMANSVKNGVLNQFNWMVSTIADVGSIPEVLPVHDIKEPDLDFDMAIHTLKLYFSTHNINKFGVDFSAGLLTEFDATLKSKVPGLESQNVYWRGSMDTSGISLLAQMQALQLSDVLLISGDPLKKMMLPNSGYVEIPDDDRLDISTGTVEGWVFNSAWSATTSYDHTFVNHYVDGTAGYRIDLGDPELVCGFDDLSSCESFGSAAYPCAGPAADPALEDDKTIIRKGSWGGGALSKVAQDVISCGLTCPDKDQACLDGCIATYPATLDKLSAGCIACYAQQLNCEQRARVRVTAADSSGVRIAKSVHGVVPEARLSHVAVTIADDDVISVYADGRSAELFDDNAPIVCDHLCTQTDCATACDGGQCTTEECLGLQRPSYDATACTACLTQKKNYYAIIPAPAAAPVVIGDNLEMIDDIRFWTYALTPGQLMRNSKHLPVGYFSDPTLIARYEADYDELSGADPGVAHNSRLYLDDSQMHGQYKSDAAVYHDTTSNDVIFKLELPTGFAILSSGFMLRAGVTLNISQINYSSTVLAELALSLGSANGMFYGTGIGGGLPIFKLGPNAELGEFLLGGDGPNTNRGDFDDGLYGSIDMMTTPAPSVIASGALIYKDQHGKSQVIADAAFEDYCPQAGTCSEQYQYQVKIEGRIVKLGLDIPGLETTLEDALVSFGTDDRICICHSNNPAMSCGLEMTGGCNSGGNSGYPEGGTCTNGVLECYNTGFHFDASSGKMTVAGQAYPSNTRLSITEEKLNWDSLVDFNFGFFDFGELSADLSIGWADHLFCADTYYDSAGVSGTPAFRTDLAGCATDSDLLGAIGIDSGGFCLADIFCPGGQFCSFGLCTPKYADGSGCLSATNCTSGFCAITCYTPRSKNIGEACVINDQCASNACFGVCTCSDDSDCASSDRCIGTGSAALCVPKEHGFYCSDVSQCPNTTDYVCASGEFGSAQCLKKNGSSWNSLYAGQACYADQECVSGNCKGNTSVPSPGICNCTTAGGCSSGQACITTIGDVNACTPTAEGTLCYHDSDCSGSRTCRVGDFSGIKQCLTTGGGLDAGQACMANSHCASGNCVGNTFVGVQGSPGVCNCSNNDQCSNGYCFASVCFPSWCNSDSECPSSKYCAAGGCYDKAGKGAICTRNGVCNSNSCTWQCVWSGLTSKCGKLCN